MRFLFIVTAFCFTVNTFAYIPPSNYQIAQLAKKHRGLKSFRVKTRITGTGTQIREIGYYDAATKIWKGHFLDKNDREIYAFEKKLASTDPQTSLTSLLLFETNSEKLLAKLKAIGIPAISEAELLSLPGEPERNAAERTSIGRLDKKIGWIIGDETASLWVLKDEFVPLKLVCSGREIRFEETKAVHDFPYPRSITLYRGNEFVLKGEVMEVMTAPDLSDMKAIKVDGVPAISSTLPSEERSLLEQWVQWIR